MPIALCARIPVILKHRRMLPQDLYSAKFKQLQTKLKAYEQGEAVYQSRYGELRQECQSLQAQVTTIEASRRQLEDSLKDETSARAQLVTEIFHMRKVGVQARWSLIWFYSKVINNRHEKYVNHMLLGVMAAGEWVITVRTWDGEIEPEGDLISLPSTTDLAFIIWSKALRFTPVPVTKVLQIVWFAVLRRASKKRPSPNGENGFDKHGESTAVGKQQIEKWQDSNWGGVEETETNKCAWTSQECYHVPWRGHVCKQQGNMRHTLF
jgi:hypothetical protein